MPTHLDDLLHRLASAPVDPRLAALTDARPPLAEGRRPARSGAIGLGVMVFAVAIGIAGADDPRRHDARMALNPLGSTAPSPLLAAVNGN